MKMPINKSNLERMPEPVRDIVKAWRARHRRRFFHFYETHNFWTEEGARYTAINLCTGRSASAETASMMSGTGQIMPARECPLPPGNCVVEEGWFCGTPSLTIFFNPARPAPLAATTAINNLPALEITHHE
jgi:hypothetical protein